VDGVPSGDARLVVPEADGPLTLCGIAATS
jgi:hypothetical protein